MGKTIYRGASIEERLCQRERAANPHKAHLIQPYNRGAGDEGNPQRETIQIFDAGSQSKGSGNDY